jgi:uncharacterized protein (DUF433 family)
MTDRRLVKRIIADLESTVGKPAIRGTRLTVEFVLILLAHGASIAEILDEYEGRTVEDVRARLSSVTERQGGATFMPRTAVAA